MDSSVDSPLKHQAPSSNCINTTREDNNYFSSEEQIETVINLESQPAILDDDEQVEEIAVHNHETSVSQTAKLHAQV